MEDLGVRFVPDEQELVEYLRYYDRGQTLHSFGAIKEEIDPYSCRPDQLQNVNENGSNYFYANREGRSRKTLDGSGFWKSKDKKKQIHKDGQIVAYKQNFAFYLENSSNSTGWVMTEYTLPHNTKAICVIRKTAGNQRNEIGQASTNPDVEDIYGQLSPLCEFGI